MTARDFIPDNIDDINISLGIRPAVAPTAANLARLASILACPVCSSGLQFCDDALKCRSCGRCFPVIDDIPDLALFDGLPDFVVSTDEGRAYQHKYTEMAAAAAYQSQFRQNRHKQARTRRELYILRTLLGHIGRSERMLNLPSGGGRLSRPLSYTTRLLVEADISIAQIRHSLSHGLYDQTSTTAFVAASGFQLPFCDMAFDVTVCARLLHHFSVPADHQRLVDELCRVSRRFVILSFNDSHSVKAILRRLRGKSASMTLTRQAVVALARAAGFCWRKAMTVSPLGSRHTYVLLERTARELR